MRTLVASQVLQNVLPKEVCYEIFGFICLLKIVPTRRWTTEGDHLGRGHGPGKAEVLQVVDVGPMSCSLAA